MITPKEKATGLVEKFSNTTHPFSRIMVDGKQCALIAVEEIISLRKGYFACTNPMNDEKYWQNVKHEIELL